VSILAISGSLPAGSSNRAVLGALQARAERRAHDRSDRDVVVIHPSLDALPYFNPDLDGEPVDPAVAALRRALAAADGVVFASPEYAHSLPGVLKNALDWIVGSGELYAKPVVVLCASPRPTGGELGRAALVQTLEAQGARVLLSATVPVLRRNDRAAELTNDATNEILDRTLDLLTARAADPSRS
jgi:NAD(P)H-dependent FMN reductase